jgi:hypothetical protein
MVVDLAKFAIDPDLADIYMQKIGMLFQTYLYPNGLARYGYQITRVTIMMGKDSDPTSAEGLFANRFQAYRYIHRQIRQRATVPKEQTDDQSQDRSSTTVD